MNKIDIFSPFFYKFKINEHSLIKNAYLDSIIKNYNHSPHHSHDWDVHTSFLWKDTLLNNLDWWESELNWYSGDDEISQNLQFYVNEFIKYQLDY